MAKKNKNKLLLLGGLVLGFVLLRPKSSKAQPSPLRTNSSSTANQPQEQKQLGGETNALTGVQRPQNSVLYPSQVNQMNEAEKAQTRLNWNFGMIALTAKRWPGEIASTQSVKTFINRYAGLGAVFYLLWVYINNRKLTTIRAIGNTWASRNKNIWIAKVSEYSGFSPDEPLKSDSSFLFPLAYAIALYYQPEAKNYISNNTLMAALDYAQKNYKITIQ